MRATSHIFSTMRGKVGGIVYLTTPLNSIVARAYAIPVNPSTERQGLARNALAAGAMDWTALGQSVRDEWNSYADAGFGVSKGGRRLFTTTRQLIYYIQSNLPAEVVAPIDEPPNLLGTPYVMATNVVYGGGSSTTGITIRYTNLSAFTMLVFSAPSVQQSPARERFKGPWDTKQMIVTSVPANDFKDQDYTDGSYAEGNKLFIRYRPFMQLRGTGGASRGDLVGFESYISDSLQTAEA